MQGSTHATNLPASSKPRPQAWRHQRSRRPLSSREVDVLLALDTHRRHGTAGNKLLHPRTIPKNPSVYLERQNTKQGGIFSVTARETARVAVPVAPQNSEPTVAVSQQISARPKHKSIMIKVPQRNAVRSAAPEGSGIAAAVVLQQQQAHVKVAKGKHGLSIGAAQQRACTMEGAGKEQVPLQHAHETSVAAHGCAPTMKNLV